VAGLVPVLGEAEPLLPVVQPGDLYSMNTMLRQVVVAGTGTKARVEGQDIAGKTGTSQDYRDGWFIGYSPYLITGVWAGNDDNSPSAKMTGGSIPAEIFADIMLPAHEGLPFAELPGDPGQDDDVPVAGGFDPYGQEPVQQQPQAQAQGGGFFDALRGLFGGNRQQPQTQPAQARQQGAQKPAQKPAQRQNTQQKVRDSR